MVNGWNCESFYWKEKWCCYRNDGVCCKWLISHLMRAKTFAKIVCNCALDTVHLLLHWITKLLEFMHFWWQISGNEIIYLMRISSPWILTLSFRSFSFQYKIKWFILKQGLVFICISGAFKIRQMTSKIKDIIMISYFVSNQFFSHISIALTFMMNQHLPNANKTIKLTTFHNFIFNSRSSIASWHAIGHWTRAFQTIYWHNV